MKIKFFLCFGAGDGIPGMQITVLPRFASLQHVILIHLHRHGCLRLNDVLLCCLCLFTVYTNNAPVTQQVALFASFSVLLPLFLQGGGIMPWHGNKYSSTNFGVANRREIFSSGHSHLAGYGVSH